LSVAALPAFAQGCGVARRSAPSEPLRFDIAGIPANLQFK